MLNNLITRIFILLSVITGMVCGLLLIFVVFRIIPPGNPIAKDPLVNGFVFGILGIIIPLIAYKLIRPDFVKIDAEKTVFGEMSKKIYSFFLIGGIGGSFIYLSISAFMRYFGIG